MIEIPRLPLGRAVADVVDVVTDNGASLFDGISTVLGGLYDGIVSVLTFPPALVMIVVLAAIAFLARGWVFGVGSLVGFTLIASLNQWDNAMDTLALVLVAALLAVLISVPVGILAARSRVTSAIVKPILDLLQTMPPFVYLIPALLLFGIGDVPGIVATVLFAVAPGVRLTELGIRGVDSEVVEAGQAFGGSPMRILRQIQLPLALPSIMAGINQVIMLSLSMVVIASLVGAGGLGSPVTTSLQRVDIALGVEGGLGVVILAIYLDRLTASFGSGKSAFASLFALTGARRRRASAPAATDPVDQAAQDEGLQDPASEEPAVAGRS